MTTVVKRDPVTGRNLGNDLTGQRFGQLTVLSATAGRKDNGYIVWRLRCDCGAEIERPSYRLMRGLTCCPACAPKGRPRLPDRGAHVNSVYAHYQRSARLRDLEFTLTKDEARRLFELPCTYCGCAPEPRLTHHNLSGTYAWNGIDRVDNARGYVRDNCVPCCGVCNFAKAGRSAEEFIGWAKRVAAHTN